ncbi:hypothetical protein GQ53DRAFT_750239 [Thozetella sp. PMI_491]|nr:hypothetical protein GQ53DRAFT_750239 [Thozetella sp. PMI_491]
MCPQQRLTWTLVSALGPALHEQCCTRSSLARRYSLLFGSARGQRLALCQGRSAGADKSANRDNSERGPYRGSLRIASFASREDYDHVAHRPRKKKSPLGVARHPGKRFCCLVLFLSISTLYDQVRQDPWRLTIYNAPWTPSQAVLRNIPPPPFFFLPPLLRQLSLFHTPR